MSSKETATVQIPAEQQQKTRAEEKPVVEKQTKFLESTDDDDETKLLEIQAVAVSAKNDTEVKEIEANETNNKKENTASAEDGADDEKEDAKQLIQLKISTAQFLLNKLPKVKLVNKSNACYMNSLLRCLYSISVFKDEIIELKTSEDSDKALFALKMAFKDMDCTQDIGEEEENDGMLDLAKTRIYNEL